MRSQLVTDDSLHNSYHRACAKSASATRPIPGNAAALDDRIAPNERRPQKYGTLFDQDARDEMGP